MKSISILALAIALGGALAVPASAKEQPAPAATPAPPPIKLSKGADKPVRALDAAVKAKDKAAYPAALAAAQAAASTDEDRYAIARSQLTYALDVNDVPGQTTAIEALLTNPVLPAESKPAFYLALADLYRDGNNLDQAAATYEKLIALEPTNTKNLWRLEDVRLKQKNNAAAVALGEQAIKIAKDSGQPVDVNWYRRALDSAYKGKLQAPTDRLARNLFAASTDARDRRNALLIYRQNTDLDENGDLDTMRLMRSAKALNEPADMVSLAMMLSRHNYPAEAMAVINEGVAAGKIKATDSAVAQIIAMSQGKVADDKAALPGLATRAAAAAKGDLAFNVANGYFGHGDYSKAAELYRLAIQKGAPDQELAKLRLGMTLALAGQSAEAETMLKSVSGPRAGLASYWMLWLANKG